MEQIYYHQKKIYKTGNPHNPITLDDIAQEIYKDYVDLLSSHIQDEHKVKELAKILGMKHVKAIIEQLPRNWGNVVQIWDDVFDRIMWIQI